MCENNATREWSEIEARILMRTAALKDKHRRTCIVCGKRFDIRTCAVMCSAACRAQRKRELSDARNARRRQTIRG